MLTKKSSVLLLQQEQTPDYATVGRSIAKARGVSQSARQLKCEPKK
jgi:hypothetical protein